MKSETSEPLNCRNQIGKACSGGEKKEPNMRKDIKMSESPFVNMLRLTSHSRIWMNKQNANVTYISPFSFMKDD